MKQIILNEKGSMTVEAAIVFPIFIFAVISIVFFFQIILFQLQLQYGLNQTAREISQYSYIYKEYEQTNKANSYKEENLPEEATSVVNKIASSSIVKVQMNDFFSKSNIHPSFVSGGVKGISYSFSSVLKKTDNIDLVAYYKVKIPVPVFSIQKFSVVQRVYTRGFVGTNLIGEPNSSSHSDTDTIMVYITETGTVYHRNLSCRHLCVDIQSCSIIDIKSKRNLSGGKYYPCEKCCKNCLENQTVYITEDGKCYHSSITCPGLKRTVKVVPLSSVSNYRPCKRCG
ncbi:TadE/TadG family type IV pilus assembly protein [Anaeromicropila populeti]|uniref:TadE-like protein n=1 Tax=Anaeromicropila populeti TaxID=37658 RepID=A0A1I6LS07_9FIRM|nr:TadE/TadG family type IV pilus assembly protein [Anaeromicropila populeti]SFS06275.1 TadE-like protein [Anaeromicropila populeti]